MLKKVCRLIPDKLYLKIAYYYFFKKRLNLKNPKTFNEKLQWLKIYDRKNEYTKMVDKYEARFFIANKIGKEYLIPLLGVWDSADDIDFNSLPDQFVLKTTHDSGGVRICKNKNEFDFNEAKLFLNKRLKSNFFYFGREWPYKNVKPRIIAEKYLKESNSDNLKDYKIYCFNGVPKYCQVISDRYTHETIDFYDMEWNHQNFVGLTKNVHNAKYTHTKPVNLDLMINFSKILSKNIPFIRVDFFEVNKKLYFGELTFYPASGFGKFTPDEWNYRIGELINLNLIAKD
ncbi:MAG: ATP-grasp fold amidoligase family protein [Thomasclavelia sp.]